MAQAIDLKLVHEDARGELYAINLPDNREIMLLHSKAGTLRGGHSHSVPEQVLVLTGRMLYHKMPPGRSGIVLELEPGDCSFNDAGMIHMGQFETDAWVLELKLAKKGEWTQENYPPWREMVEANIREFRA